MAINNYFVELSEDFDIFGKLNNKIKRFRNGFNFQAFLIQLKKS